MIPAFMPAKKISAKKPASHQLDQLIMAMLVLVVVGAAIIVWQNWTIKVMSTSYSSAESYINIGTQRTARLAESKSELVKENEVLMKRLERWNVNAEGSSRFGGVLKVALLQSGFNQDDPFLWELYILRVNKVIDDPKTPYSIMVVSDGTQDRGLLVAKRLGEDQYQYVPGTFFIVPNYAHQVVQNVKWAAAKQVGYEILTKVEGGSPDIVDKKTLDIKE